MAELTFDCPHCRQPITCDDQWAGQQIQCPACQGAIIVPAKPAGAPGHNPLVPKPPPGGSRLSVGQAQKPATPGRAIPIRNLAPEKAKKKNPLVAFGIPVLLIAILGAVGYFGYNYYQEYKAKKEEAARAAAAAAAAAQSNATQQAAAQAAAAVAPPVWTLDVDAAKIPTGRANGMLSGTNFVPEIARVDHLGTQQLLRLVQGQLLSPDKALLIYLHLKPGESIENYSLEVNKDMKGVPPISKLWKPVAGGQPALKSFSTGYALKLQFGQSKNGVIPGKLYLALPDPEQTVVGGNFEATNGLATASAVTTPQAPAAAPTPMAPKKQ